MLVGQAPFRATPMVAAAIYIGLCASALASCGTGREKSPHSPVTSSPKTPSPYDTPEINPQDTSARAEIDGVVSDFREMNQRLMVIGLASLQQSLTEQDGDLHRIYSDITIDLRLRALEACTSIEHIGMRSPSIADYAVAALGRLKQLVSGQRRMLSMEYQAAIDKRVEGASGKRRE